MKITMAIVLSAFAAALLFSREAAQNMVQRQNNSDQDLNKRISKLEEQVQALQQQVKELELKSRYRFLAVPQAQLPGKQIPPGSKRYSFNGQDIWLVPLGPGR